MTYTPPKTKILMLSYFYPPLTGVGTKRITNFSNYLPQFGFEPVLIAVSPESIRGQHRSFGQVDADAALPIEPREVRHVPIPWLQQGWYQTLRRFKIFRGLILLLSIPDHVFLWIWPVLREASRLLQQERISLVFATAPPFSCLVAAAWLKRRYPRLVLITDWRDEWTTNCYFRPLTALHRWLNHQLENFVIAQSDVIVTVTPGVAGVFRQRLAPAAQGKVTMIENAYSPTFYQIAPELTDRFTITYTGMVYGKHLPDNLIEVLDSLIPAEIPAESIRLRLIGGKTSFPAQRLTVEELPFVSQEKLRTYKAESALLLTLLSEEQSQIYPAKLIDSMVTGLPVLALVPAGSVAQSLVEQSRCGFCCPLEDKETMRALLLELYQLWRRGELKTDPDWAFIEGFSPTARTQALANLLAKYASE